MEMLLFPAEKHNQNGFGFVEMLVTVAVGGVVVFGMIAMINVMTRGAWSLSGNVSLVSQGREAFDLISKDFKCAKASTMGNLAQNPGFEDPLSLSLNPVGWEPLTADVTKTGTYGTDIKSGVIGIKVSNGASYRSNSFNVSAGKKFIISGWVKNSGRVNLVKASDNTNLTTPLSNSNSYWTHLSTTVVLGAAETVKLNTSLPAGSWQSCSPLSDLDITAMATYNGRLHIGTWEQARVYSYVGTSGTYDANWGWGWNPHVESMVVYDPDYNGPLEEMIMACRGMFNWGNSWSWGSWAFRYRKLTGGWLNGWPLATDSPPGDQGITTMLAYKDKLYIGTTNYSSGQIKEYDPSKPAGSRWRTIFTSNQNGISALCVYDDGTGERLYAGSRNGGATWHLPAGQGNVYVYDFATDSMMNGGAPVLTPAPSWAVLDMVVYKNKLYVAGDYLYVLNSINPWSWTKIIAPGTSMSLCIFNDKLYAGNWSGGIWTFDGTSWTAFTGIGSKAIKKLGVSNNTLYAGGSNGGWGGIGVWAWINEAYFDDVSLSPEEVVFDSSTVAGTDTYTYYVSKGNTESEMGRFKLYRLRYEVIPEGDPAAPGRLFREYSGDNGATWKPQGLSAAGVICENVKKCRIINHNQESFEVELVLEKEIQKGKKKEILLRNTFTPTIS